MERAKQVKAHMVRRPHTGLTCCWSRRHPPCSSRWNVSFQNRRLDGRLPSEVSPRMLCCCWVFCLSVPLVIAFHLIKISKKLYFYNSDISRKIPWGQSGTYFTDDPNKILFQKYFNKWLYTHTNQMTTKIEVLILHNYTNPSCTNVTYRPGIYYRGFGIKNISTSIILYQTEINVDTTWYQCLQESDFSRK